MVFFFFVCSESRTPAVTRVRTAFWRRRWRRPLLPFQVQFLKSHPVNEADFTQFRVLGRGGFGLVYGCMRKTTGHLYAMKTMDRRRVKMKKAGDLCWNERIILGRLNSPFIVCLK